MTTRPPTAGKLPLTDLAEMKRRGERIVMVTAYDYPSGRIADAAGIDVVLVGDSAAMTVLGHDSTVPATMDDMIFLSRAAARGARRPLVVADMPFGSYQVSDEEAVRNAIRFVKEAGVDAVKLEGAGPMLPRIASIVGAGDTRHGPHRADAAVGDDARRLSRRRGGRQPAPTSWSPRRFRSRRPAASRSCSSACRRRWPPGSPPRWQIPTIGIGAGADCDGQVLVFHDMLGLYEGRSPRFVKRYAELADAARAALEAYAAEVRSGAFPQGPSIRTRCPARSSRGSRQAARR